MSVRMVSIPTDQPEGRQLGIDAFKQFESYLVAKYCDGEPRASAAGALLLHHCSPQQRHGHSKACERCLILSISRRIHRIRDLAGVRLS